MVGNIFREFPCPWDNHFSGLLPKQKKNKAQFSRSKHRIPFTRKALQCHPLLKAREYSLNGSQTHDMWTTSALYSMDETICLGDCAVSQILWGNRRVLIPPGTNMSRSTSWGMTRKYFQKADENRDGLDSSDQMTHFQSATLQLICSNAQRNLVSIFSGCRAGYLAKT